jgi:hypothetical protein
MIQPKDYLAQPKDYLAQPKNDTAEAFAGLSRKNWA